MFHHIEFDNTSRVRSRRIHVDLIRNVASERMDISVSAVVIGSFCEASSFQGVLCIYGKPHLGKTAFEESF